MPLKIISINRRKNQICDIKCSYSITSGKLSKQAIKIQELVYNFETMYEGLDIREAREGIL